MATDDDGREVVLATFNDEWQAALMRETLLSEGIRCVIAGGYTGSFRAEAPGRVKLLVHEADLVRAEEAIRRRREEAASIDWSAVDLGGEGSEVDEESGPDRPGA